MRFNHPINYAFVILIFWMISTIARTETISIATGEYPPWTSQELPNNGFINHLVTQAFEVHNIEVEFHYLPWKRALEATKVGQFHASSFWSIDKKRQGDFYQSDKIEIDAFVFFKRRSLALNSWDKLASLGDYRIGATRGYTYSQEFWALSKANKLRVSLANSDLKNLQRLINGEIDLFPISEVTGKYLLKHQFPAHKTLKVASIPKPLNSNQAFILFNKVNPENERYVRLFNQGLKQLHSQNKIEAFRQEFFQ